LPGPVPCPTAFSLSTGGLVPREFSLRHRLSPVFAGIFFVSAFAKLLFTLELFYLSLYYINPLSPFNYDPFDTTRIRIRFSLLNPSIRAENFESYASILPSFTVLFTGKANFGGASPTLQAQLQFSRHAIALIPF
jgi:hypothetical protein